MSTDFILGLIFLCFAGFSALLRKTYFELPLAERRKRSALGEEMNGDITKSLSYGPALRSLLWLSFGLTLAVSLTLFARALPVWAGVIVAYASLFYLFSFLPNTKISGLGRWLTSLLSPSLNWILKRTSKYLSSIYKPLAKHYVAPVSPIFDSQDLLNFLKAQSRRVDHRIEPEAFVVLERSLGFGNLRIGDLMTPSKKVKTLLESDIIGPILINELHESSEGYALVRDEPKGDITGLLTISDLSIRSQGSVGSHMRKDICFVSNDDFAANVIKSFYDTKGQIFVVVNSNKKFVGTISLETVIKQLIGPLDNLATQPEVLDSPETVAKTDD